VSAAPSDHADTHADHRHGSVQGHGTRAGYLTGFLLSVVLTVIPFWLVMTHAIANLGAVAVIIFALAAIQIVVHVRYFLHLDSKAEGGWTLMSFAFTVLIVGIVIGGSVWVMFHLNINMMPTMPADMTQAP